MYKRGRGEISRKKSLGTSAREKKLSRISSGGGKKKDKSRQNLSKDLILSGGGGGRRGPKSAVFGRGSSRDKGGGGKFPLLQPIGRIPRFPHRSRPLTLWGKGIDKKKDRHVKGGEGGEIESH